MQDYIEVRKNTLDEAVEKGPWTRAQLKSDMQDADYRDCTLVIFEAKDEWHRIFVNNKYPVGWFMREMTARWSG